MVEFPLDLGSSPITLEVRVGRTGTGNAGLDLPGDPGVRILFDRLGGISVFPQGQTPPAPSGRPTGSGTLGRTQSLVLERTLRGGMRVRHGGTTLSIPDAGLEVDTVAGKFWVRDGALKIVLPAGHSVPSGFILEEGSNESESDP